VTYFIARTSMQINSQSISLSLRKTDGQVGRPFCNRLRIVAIDSTRSQFANPAICRSHPWQLAVALAGKKTYPTEAKSNRTGWLVAS
jgi:hypothetical protein